MTLTLHHAPDFASTIVRFALKSWNCRIRWPSSTSRAAC